MEQCVVSQPSQSSVFIHSPYHAGLTCNGIQSPSKMTWLHTSRAPKHDVASAVNYLTARTSRQTMCTNDQLGQALFLYWALAQAPFYAASSNLEVCTESRIVLPQQIARQSGVNNLSMYICNFDLPLQDIRAGRVPPVPQDLLTVLQVTSSAY